ncbi:hypothetical protein BKA70DRAFT_1117490 [Coprinopsis sp. MPI-PUGE-AT-0042]|nr:hypothetical protein BKA70DRAFT_1117490 [Coprinopsis sp. MPI-PUGE-AT-0042]
MRYGSCTASDIAFLRSRISTTIEGFPSISDPEFRNVSIITTRNVLKDTINELGSKRFAEETGQTLHFFYSEDAKALKNQYNDNRQKKVNVNADINSPQLQNALWTQPCSCTDKLIPGRIGICVGLPVMIRNNSATEMCITKGQEGHVYSWQTTVGTKGQPMLETLFVELSNPPKKVSFKGLPENVVPILPTTTYGVQCSLHDGSKVFINRTQVEVLPNFAMTDFSSQGKTRQFNVIDAESCTDHQSFYTALSRGSTARGTLILQNFSPQSITGGIDSGLRQEFRSLEILDEITDLRYNGDLPEFIDGTHRKDLISAFRTWRGSKYVPKHTHKAIRWNKCSKGDEWENDDSPIEPWKLVVTDKSKNKSGRKGALTVEDDYVPACGQKALVSRESGPSTHNAVPFRIKRVPSETSLVPDVASKRMRTNIARSTTSPSQRPLGIVWSNNSCPYDSLLVVLHHIWADAPDRWTAYLQRDDRPYMALLLDKFRAMARGVITFENARECLRRLLAERPSNEFRYGEYTSPADVFYYLTLAPPSEGLVSFTQRSCGFCFAQLGARPIQSRENALSAHTSCTSTQEWVQMSYRWISSHNKCPHCGHLAVMRRTYNQDLRIVFIHLPPQIRFDTISPTITIRTAGQDKTLHVRGVIYFGSDHFTSRIVSPSGKVWYHDGSVTASQVEDEGLLHDDFDMSECRGRLACDLIYSEQD